jgi:Nucleolar protein,Nop52
MSASAGLVKIVHELANGVDKSVRDKAMQKTQQYLSEHGSELNDTDFARLWQGLYFCT